MTGRATIERLRSRAEEFTTRNSQGRISGLLVRGPIQADGSQEVCRFGRTGGPPAGATIDGPQDVWDRYFRAGLHSMRIEGEPTQQQTDEARKIADDQYGYMLELHELRRGHADI